jgi:glycosyltransferase involved in cell wall biosynthesis
MKRLPEPARRPSRQFFFAPIVLPQYNRLHAQRFVVGAAAHKVAGMAASVRSQRARAIVVSAPIVTASRTQRYFEASAGRDQRIGCAYLPVLSLRGLNRLFAAFTYLWFAISRVRAGDGVVLYNYFPEYVLAAVFLRWRLGRDKVVMDLEDGPRADEKNLRGYLNRFSLRLLSLICSPRAIVVSQQLARVMRIDQACVVNGVSPETNRPRGNFNSPVTFLYGGSIELGTGLELFAGALRVLVRMHPALASRVRFVVTGFGGAAVLQPLARELAASGFELDICQDVGPDEYRRILMEADVGLSLKLPSGALDATTFPSKVIELASQGLLVMTTNISDISRLFDSASAAILAIPAPAALAELIAAVAEDPLRYQAIAAAGQRRIVESCSRRSVGRRLVKFLGVQPTLQIP